MPDDNKVLFQPIETKAERNEEILTIQYFIELLKKEEAYYNGDQNNTQLMVTRFRKIFYDTPNWDKTLIKGAADIQGRYQNDKFSENENTPLICRKANQEIKLEDGLRCDLGHVFAGLDALNYPEVVTPLPGWLRWARKLFPSNDYNSDIVTWLGDIASVAGEFVVRSQNNHELSLDEKQELIFSYAQGADMLGNIDAYVIGNTYNMYSDNGLKISDILYDYYCSEGIGEQTRKRRYSIFCSVIGLTGWDGENFDNEKSWMKYNIGQLRNNTLFYTMNRFSDFKRLGVGLKTWFRRYDKQIDAENLLNSFLTSIKKLKKKETLAGFSKMPRGLSH